MKVLDLFSGISAPSVAWHPLGWETLAFAEIEPFPSSLLKHRYPDIPNLGDVSKHEEWPDYEPDVVVGGSPCQAFSVAGLRKGLDDPRGNLTLTYLAVVNQYRPEWVVWENVPGVLSIDGGRTFGAFLGGLAELGYGFAYRVLDAQHFGVPQRRRRVFVVGHTDWRRAAAVLFERHSMQGHPAPRREKREETSASAGGRASTGDISHCLNAGGMGRQDYESETLVPSIAKPLGAHSGDKGRGTDLDNTTYLPVTHSLRGEGFNASEDGTGRGTPIVPVGFMSTESHSSGNNIDIAPTMKTGDCGIPAVAAQSVRRLTPTECERLQGFPDGYTQVPHRNKPAADGPRYKALGNSMAVPVVRWIGERMQ